MLFIINSTGFENAPTPCYKDVNCDPRRPTKGCSSPGADGHAMLV